MHSIISARIAGWTREVNRMNELMNEIAKLTSQYGGVVLTLGIIFSIAILAIVIAIFVIVIKSIKDMDDEFDDWHKRKRCRHDM